MKLGRFFRTPKGMLVPLLTLLALVSAAFEGGKAVLPELSAAVGTAMAIDAVILRTRKGRWVFPDGALLTGLIVGMILSAAELWYVAAAGSAIAIVSKYVLRARTANVFNPAALGLVVVFYVFDTPQDWWGALSDLPLAAIVLLIGVGVVIVQRVDKAPVVLAFLGAYFLLFTVSAFLADPAAVAELFRPPDLHAALFFAFFMVSDPPTSPPGQEDQVVFGVIVATLSWAAFEILGAACFLLVGLLVGNVWEAGRRLQVGRARVAREAVAR